MIRLLRLMLPFRWWILAGVLLSFAVTGASVGLMAVSAYLISKAALARDMTDLAVWITAVRFFAVSRAALRYAERYVTHLATFRILTSLRVWFYRAIEPLAPARLAQYRSGDLLVRIVADIETLENFYLRVVIPPLAAALVTLLACLILGSFDVWLGVAVLVFILLTGVLLPLASRQLSRQPAAAAIARARRASLPRWWTISRASPTCWPAGRRTLIRPGRCAWASSSTRRRSGWPWYAAWATGWPRSLPAWPR